MPASRLSHGRSTTGPPPGGDHSHRSLEIYHGLASSIGRGRRADNFGGFAYPTGAAGRGGRALSSRRRGQRACRGTSPTRPSATATSAMLSDSRGGGRRRSQALREAVRIWRGRATSGQRLCHRPARPQHGSGRAPRQGLELLEASLTDVRQLGATSDAALVEAYIAEAHAFPRRPTCAAIADRLLRDARRTAPLSTVCARSPWRAPRLGPAEASLGSRRAQGRLRGRRHPRDRAPPRPTPAMSARRAGGDGTGAAGAARRRGRPGASARTALAGPRPQPRARAG